MCFTLGASIAEIVSAFPTAGGLYTASARKSEPSLSHIGPPSMHPFQNLCLQTGVLSWVGLLDGSFSPA